MENIKVKVINIKDIELLKDYITKEDIKDNIIEINGGEYVEFKILRKLLDEKLKSSSREINRIKSRINDNIPIGYGISIEHDLEERLNVQNRIYDKIKDVSYYLEDMSAYITIQVDREKNIIREKEEFELELEYISGCVDTEENFLQWINMELEKALESFKEKFSKYKLNINLDYINLDECHYDDDEQIGEITANIICSNWVVEDNNIDVEENFDLDEELFGHLKENGFYEL